MSKIDRSGTFRGVITQNGIIETKESKLPMFVCQFRATELYDNSEVGNEQWVDWSQFEECEATGYFCLVSKKGEVIGFQVENLMKALGWSGQSLEDLVTTDFSGITVQFRVENDTYNDKPTLSVTHIDHADAQPGGTLRTLDVKEVKKLDAKFAKAFKKFSGGPKPKAVGKPEKPAANPAPTAAEEKTEPTAPEKPKKPGKPPKPSRSEDKADRSPIAEHLDLPVKANEDEAWDQVSAHVSDEFGEKHISEAWLEAIDTLGGPEAIDKQKSWAKVRDIVLEKLTDNPAL